MDGPSFSNYHVLSAFQHLLKGQSLTEGALGYDKLSYVGQVRNWVDQLLNENDINDRTSCLKKQTFFISANIINTKLHNGRYECIVRFGDHPFAILQIEGSRTITIIDGFTNETIELDDVDFPHLQRQALRQFLNDERAQYIDHIDLLSMDLEGIDLNGMDFSHVVIDENQASLIAQFNVDLSNAIIQPATDGGTLLTRQQLNEHIKNNQNLTGKKLKAGESTVDLFLDDLAFDKTMAESLIDAGMDMGYVVRCYLQTPPTRGSDLYKAKMLQNVLDQRRATLVSGEFIDLSDFDLSDVAPKYYDKNTNTQREMNFSKVLLDQNGLASIFSTGGNLRGAKLAPGVQAHTLGQLSGIKLDKNIAIQLIDAGANPRTVLILYLASERELGNKAIDLSGMDLHQVTKTGLNLRDANIDGIIFAPSLDVESNEYHTQFEKDLLAVLSTFAQTVHFITKQSSSRDIATLDRQVLKRVVPMAKRFAGQDPSAHLAYLNTIPDEQSDKAIQEKFFRHHFVVRHIRRKNETVSKLREGIKVATGNCHEKAEICQDLIELYLQETLSLLGYGHFHYHLIPLATKSPNDHRAIELIYLFNGKKMRYLVDPWGLGHASKYDEGVERIRSRPSTLISADFEFEQLNGRKDTAEQRQQKNAIFIRSGVKEQLNLALRAQFRSVLNTTNG